MTKLMLFDKYEKALQSSQVNWITKKFGSKAASNANYGWVSEGKGQALALTTKIYGHGTLDSSYEDGKIVHDYEAFENETATKPNKLKSQIKSSGSLDIANETKVWD